MSEIVIYTAKDDHVQLSVNLSEETVWLSLNQAEKGIHELQQTIELLQKTLTRNELMNDLGTETIQLILSYAKTWHLLLAYDENKLALPKHSVNLLAN